MITEEPGLPSSPAHRPAGCKSKVDRKLYRKFSPWLRVGNFSILSVKIQVNSVHRESEYIPTYIPCNDTITVEKQKNETIFRF